MAAVYDVISGPIGQKRDWDRMHSLFVPDAQMMACVRRPNGDARLIKMTVDGYIAQSGPYLESKGFFEHEIARRTEEFGNIAHVFSTYESRWKPEDKKPFERGINSIELMNDGKRWWVVSIYWQGEDEKTKLPSRYLSGKK